MCRIHCDDHILLLSLILCSGYVWLAQKFMNHTRYFTSHSRQPGVTGATSKSRARHCGVRLVPPPRVAPGTVARLAVTPQVALTQEV
jgi:hypothetical protein